MAWPLPQDYNEAVQNPATSFADPELRTGAAVTDALGIPRPCSGNFADVYQVRCVGATWAVKCFTRQVAGLRERYAAVSEHLGRTRLPFGVDFQYLDQGVRVGGSWFPVVKMRWVEGLTLDAFVRANLDKPTLLDALGQIWLRMARRLREADVAHGDLQHGNVLLVPGRSAQSLAVKLIDYDGMYVPALAGKPSGELGHPNYQHPQRLREGTYGPEVDRFGLLVVAAALRCLRVGGQALWERYDNGDNLLFTEADFAAPHQSPLFAELLKLEDPAARTVAARLMAAAQKPLEETPLLEEVFADKPAAAAPPPLPAAETFRFDADEAAGRGRRRRRKKRSAAPLLLGVALAAALAGGMVFWATRPGETPVAARDDKGSTPPTTKVELGHTGPQHRKEKPPSSEAATESSDSGTPPAPEPRLPLLPPQGWTVQAHAATVRRLALSPDARQILTAGYDGVVRLWDAASGRLLLTMQRHESPHVHAVAFLPGNRAISGGNDKVLRVWELGEGRQVGTWAAGETLHLAVSPDGRRLVSCGANGTILLWDVSRQAVESRLDAGTAVASNGAFSPDSRLVAAVCNDGFVRVWAVATGKEMIRLPKGSGGEGVAFSPDGRRILAPKDRTPHVWDVKTGADLLQLEGHAAGVFAVAFTSDGRRALSCAGDHTVRVWDLASGKEIGSYAGHTSWVGDIRCMPGDRYVLSASDDHTLRLWPLPEVNR
jgi:hypothetical protein